MCAFASGPLTRRLRVCCQEPEVDDDHVDPYHGNQKPEPEPEDLDLPDDMQLDEGEANDGDEGEENPFDIDDMKGEAVVGLDMADPMYFVFGVLFWDYFGHLN